MMPATQIIPGKLLGELIAIDDQKLAAVLVSGIELDSRNVAPGDMFIACKGFVVDGRNFIDQAIAAGAVAVLAESDVKSEWSVNSERNGVPVIAVANLTQQLSEIAGRFFNHASARSRWQATGR